MKSLLSCAVCAIAPALLVPALAFAQGAPPQPVPDQTAPAAAPKAEPEPLIWRGTSFTWTTSATTTETGVGMSTIGHEDATVGFDWVFAPNIYLLDLPDDKINATVEAGVTVELTDGPTTLYREPQFRDTQIGVGYSRNIFTSADKEWSTKGNLRLRYNIPTSPASLEQGRYGVLSPGISFTQVLRLLGNGADGLNNLTVVAGFTYSHLFSRATTPTNGGLERTRQNASGATIFSDQLGFRSFDIDRVIPSVILTLPLYKDLSLTTAFRMIGRFKSDLVSTDCEVVVNGDECITAGRLEDYGQQPGARYFTDSSFDISLSQPIYDMFQLNVGYNNETLSLGEDGKTRNIFYSPGAQFYLDVAANIDVIYEKASGRKNIDLPPGPRNTVTALNEYGQPSF